MLRINIHEAKTHLSRYAKRVKAGETILLCDRNVPFAELRPLSGPPPSGRPRPLGMDAGQVDLGNDWDSVDTNREVAALFGLGDVDVSGLGDRKE